MTSRAVLLLLLTASLWGHPTSGQSQADTRLEAEQHLRAAQEYLGQQRPDLAIPELEKVVALTPGNVDARGNLGVLLYFRGDYPAAIPDLRAAVAARPELWKIRGLLGLAEQRMGDAQASRADLEAAFPHLTEPKFKSEVGNALIASYAASGEPEKAVAVVSSLLADEPTNPAILYSAYRLYSDLADKALLTTALSDPDGALMHEMMAQELARQGDEQQAIANYREALRLNPKLETAHFLLGEVLYNSSDEKLQAQAGPEFQAAIAQDPSDEKAHLALGQLAAKNGDTKTAYSEVHRAVELAPSDADALVEMGKLLMTGNEDAKAQAMFERAVQADPTNIVARYRLSMLYRRQGKSAEAEQQMTAYKKYKEMQAKLEKIFHDMRVGSLEKHANDAEFSR